MGEFYFACKNGDLKAVKECNDQHLIYWNEWNLGLMYACEGGHREIVDLAISNGATDWNIVMSYLVK